MKTNADLFDHYENLPLKIKEIISVFNTEIDVTENAYDLCKKLVSELEIHGYTCEYNLDAIPYNLQKIETTNETPEEMNNPKIVFQHRNDEEIQEVIQQGNHFFTRTTRNGECFESADFNTLERAKESLGIALTMEEKNILIAEFLQVDKNENGTFELPQFVKITIGGTFKTEFKSSQLKYHKDWNWLMEAVEKIGSTDYVTDFLINALTGYTTIETYSETEEGKNKMFGGFGEGIKGTYDAVVEFIQWHNQQKN